MRHHGTIQIKNNNNNIISDIKASLKYPARMPYFQLTPVRRPTLEKKINQLKNRLIKKTHNIRKRKNVLPMTNQSKRI